MKKLFIYFISLVLNVVAFTACSPDKELLTIKSESEVAAPEITSPNEGDVIVLSADQASETAISIEWTMVDYGVAVQTHYSVQARKEGTEEYTEIANVTTDSLVLDHAGLNEAALSLGLSPDAASNMDIVIAASVNYQLETKFSDSVKINVTPYSTIFPSIYMIGQAVGGWDPALAVEIANTGDQGVYRTNAYFDATGDAYFRFFSAPDWGSSIGGPAAFPNYPTDLLEPQPGDNNDDNFNFIGATGWYDINVNSNTGTITMTALDSQPVLYMVGDVTANGWNWNGTTPTLDWSGHELYIKDIDLVQNGSFRLFTRFEDWGSGFGHDIITNYDNTQLTPQDGSSDPNWTFLGASGTYEVKVDMRAASIVLTQK
ncbi:hypothetical protein MY04_0616 [Flammeovirga sp. MY04]|uniref:SusE domain-containing protein n=1 Tax=Flammeovirga sp. MY04 TaxID=1191459 RepID=UPI0008062296|nr:SusE domain-containing protein [Flammeovirga sp. MY04]ANQ47998.1 hypothetical protein MY04_0616 [Flammeovirga sp. MY04]